MIAIPIKMNKETSAVNTLFGKSKWYAFVSEDGKISIEANKTQSGREVVENLVKKGVTKLIFQHMGGNPFLLLQKANIECYYNGGERILLNEAVKKLLNNELIKVDGSNMAEYVEQGKMHNGGNKDHHHDHDHHHEHDHSHHH